MKLLAGQSLQCRCHCIFTSLKNVSSKTEFFVFCCMLHPLQMLRPPKKWNSSLKQKLLTRKFKLLNVPPRLFYLAYSLKISSLVRLLGLHFDISVRGAAFWKNFDVNIRITCSQVSALVIYQLNNRLYDQEAVFQSRERQRLFSSHKCLEWLTRI